MKALLQYLSTFKQLKIVHFVFTVVFTWTPRAVSRLTVMAIKIINLCVVSYSCDNAGFLLVYPSTHKKKNQFFCLLTFCFFTLEHHQLVTRSKPAEKDLIFIPYHSNWTS